MGPTGLQLYLLTREYPFRGIFSQTALAIFPNQTESGTFTTLGGRDPALSTPTRQVRPLAGWAMPGSGAAAAPQGRPSEASPPSQGRSCGCWVYRNCAATSMAVRQTAHACWRTPTPWHGARTGCQGVSCPRRGERHARAAWAPPRQRWRPIRRPLHAQEPSSGCTIDPAGAAGR